MHDKREKRGVELRFSCCNGLDKSKSFLFTFDDAKVQKKMNYANNFEKMKKISGEDCTFLRKDLHKQKKSCNFVGN